MDCTKQEQWHIIIDQVHTSHRSPVVNAINAQHSCKGMRCWILSPTGVTPTHVAIMLTHCDTCVRVHVGRIRYITACIHTQLHVQSLYCMQSHTHAFSDSIAIALPQFIAWWFDLLQGDTCHGKNIFQHVWLSQYWNCMAGCNVELLWNMWYKTDQRISQFPACWFVFLHCDTCHENTHSNIYDYHNIEHVWCDVIVKLKKQNMYTCNDTGTRIWEEHCIPVRHEKHDHCTRIRDEHCIPMRQEKHEHCTRIWRNIAFLNDKKTRALHSNLGGTLESIHKKLWLHRIQGGQALPPLLY